MNTICNFPLIVYLSVSGCLVLTVWFLSDFKIHFINTLFKTDLDSSNINEFIAMKFDFKILKTDFSVASLLMCPICIGFWISVVLTLIGGSVMYLPYIYFLQILLFATLKKLMQ